VALLGITACSSSGTSAAPQSVQGLKASSTAAPMASGSPFGAACSAVPTDPSNKGSFDAMSKVPVATAARGNPELSTLGKAVTAAGLGDTLNNADGITVFAPDNDAFAKIPADTLNGVLANKDQLTKILEYHVVSGRLSPDQLAGTHKTLEGDS